MPPTTLDGFTQSFAGFLESSFSTVKNRITWDDLAGTIVGALLFKLWTGVISIPLAVAESIKSLVSSIVGGANAGVLDITSTLTSEFAAAWDPLQWGVFSVVPNIAVLLVTAYVVARGYEVITGVN